MAELSHGALRTLVSRFGGCDKYYSEMISAGSLVFKGPFEKYYLDPAPASQKLVFQLCSGKTDLLCRAAEILDDLECAGIDINMGCSAPAILRQGGGAAWLYDIDAARKMVSSVSCVVKNHSLSVKLRTGKEDNFAKLLAFCKMLEGEGVRHITLHPRTTKEKLRGGARWEYVKQLQDELQIPVTGNGDIKSAAELVQRCADAPHGGIMTGRLAVKCPWCFAQARGLLREDTIDLEETAFDFLDLLEKHQPKEFLYSRARRFFFYFCTNLQWGEYLKNKINREVEMRAMAKVLRDHFSEYPDEKKLQISSPAAREHSQN
ncbi:MAG: tRNA-dihydrouridine synthase family protein [Spirochaetaceae bacterium]|nr:tRNA-dihydrouridine synthase family protein [Spirochaetaceae bacterium]